MSQASPAHFSTYAGVKITALMLDNESCYIERQSIHLCELIFKVTFYFSFLFSKKKSSVLVGALKCSRHIPHFSRQKQERGIAIWPFQARIENISILSR